MPDAAGQADAVQWLRQHEADSLVLTASRRLARSLRERFDREMVSAGHAAWETPPIANLSSWFEDCYSEHLARRDRIRLQPAAAELLWERVARRHVDASLLSVTGLARQARTAWQRLNEWRVPFDRVDATARGRDEFSFAAMARDYRAELERRRFVDPAEIPGLVTSAIERGEVPVPARILLSGFDRLTPTVVELKRVLVAAGSTVDRLRLPEPAGPATLQCLADDDAELRAAGRWARSLAEASPDADIAIVVTDLEQDAGRAGRLVREGFTAGWQTGDDTDRASVEVSYGLPLPDYPVIATALLLLRWITDGLSSADLAVLLRSPWLRQDPASARVALDSRLRGLPDRMWSPQAAARVLADREEVGAPYPGWQALTAACAEASAVARERRAPARWAESIDALLEAAGWPGTEPLSSEEFQLVNRWRSGLNQLAALESVLGEADLAESVHRLSQLLADGVWQPEREGAVVRVIGPLEAAGMRFDHLWVARVDADRWPPAGRPSPLLSRALQADAGMPDATPADTLDYARRVLARLAVSAPQVNFSWARIDRDAVRSPSPLLADVVLLETGAAADPGWYATTMAGSGNVGRVARDPVPPVGEGERVSGGAATIALQRTEPFLAFAKGRLQLRELEPFATGLSAPLRGQLTHRALEILYGDLPRQDELRQWAADERRRRIERAADGAVASAAWYADDVFSELLRMERNRLVDLLDATVENDLGRSPFVVSGLEQRLDFSHAGVSVELRADRIDRLADGSLLIVDYKTGNVRNLLDRDGEPAELQLVVYATALRERIGGLSLLYIRRQGIEERAAGSAIDGKPMSAGEWQRTLNRWRALVLSLTEAIAGGDVRVNPHTPDNRNRQFDVLSRVSELSRDG